MKFRRQFSIDKYILDFYSPEFKIALEADGGPHYTEEGKKEDATRSRALKSTVSTCCDSATGTF
jgi:adenine-specific DNA-methyltransferase